MMTEMWRWIPGYEGFYAASTHGRVMSVPRLDVKKVPRGGHLMKPYIGKAGYKVVALLGPKKHRLYKIHRLVLLTFVGEPERGQVACHNNGDRLINRLDNLRWGTSKENSLDRERHGRTAKGTKNGGGTKLNDEKVGEIKVRLQKGETPSAIAKDYGVTAVCIGHIKSGRNWKHV